MNNGPCIISRWIVWLDKKSYFIYNMNWTCMGCLLVVRVEKKVFNWIGLSKNCSYITTGCWNAIGKWFSPILNKKTSLFIVIICNWLIRYFGAERIRNPILGWISHNVVKFRFIRSCLNISLIIEEFFFFCSRMQPNFIKPIGRNVKTFSSIFWWLILKKAKTKISNHQCEN